MCEYTVVISDDAQSDIVSIAGYIRRVLKNISAAKKFKDDTQNALHSLGMFPYSHPIWPELRAFNGLDVRQFVYRENYCIFYVVDDNLEEVVVIGVSYTRRNLSEIQFDYEMPERAVIDPEP